MAPDKLWVAYGDEYLDWQLGAKHPTNPERALIATELLAESLGNDFLMVAPEAGPGDRASLELVHSLAYIDEVLDEGVSGEWMGERPDLGATALSMFAGTARLVEGMIAGDVRVAFNPQGAKHHAGWSSSSGFCVFNDMAWAAMEFMAAGMKVMYIDWDAHHGDGVEDLLWGTKAVTCSIHEGGIFPGTGNSSDDKHRAYNWPLPHGANGDHFLNCMDDIRDLADIVKPDVVLLATGADAHRTDPLSSLQYDFADYKIAAYMVADIARTYSKGRVLIGGAGGYQPLTNTPLIWSQVVHDVWKYVHGDEDAEVISAIAAPTHRDRTGLYSKGRMR
jgi:acetoin utilization protein AcuC